MVKCECIIPTVDYYYPKLSKKKKYVKTIAVSYCRGLDQVHIGSEGSKTVKDIDLNRSRDGKAVGSMALEVFKYATLASLAGPAGVILGYKDTKNQFEQQELEQLHMKEQ